MFKKHLPLIKTVASDRIILAMWIAFVALSGIVIITAALHVVPSELQVTVHYTAFGVTNFYRDNWSYLIVFVAQAVLLLVAHSLITVKLFDQKGRNFAVLFLGLSIAVALISELLLAGLFRVVALVQ
jgi:hypothetical protein